MSRFLGYTVLIVCSLIYAVSMSSDWTKIITAKKVAVSNSKFESDAYRYGDLFGMSYLPYYKIEKPKLSVIKKDTCSAIKNTSLYIICDSYLWSFAVNRKAYCGVDTLMFAKTNALEELHVKLNPKKRSVLLLEYSERNLRYLMRDSTYVKNILQVSNKNYIQVPVEGQKPTLLSSLRRFTFNKSINKNLELNVWDYAFFTPIKEFKSYLNFKLFNSYDNDVEISPDTKRLLYKPTIDSGQITSSFKNLPDSELNKIIKNLNMIYDKAKAIGYNDVYLSIIPNPVTIYYPTIDHLKYNQLIDRVQTATNLKPTVINVYAKFKTAKVNLYYLTDTHWNFNGVDIWLNEFNKHLKQDAMPK